MTNYTGDFKGVLDYIWFSSKRFKVSQFILLRALIMFRDSQLTEILEPVPTESLKAYPGLPHAHHPSDHFMLGCMIVPKKDARGK